MTKGIPPSSFAGEKLVCIRGERVVFTQLDFRLTNGEALLLLGPNGSGKSSLLRVMAGLLKPADGHLAWNGAPVTDDREGHSARIHYVGHHDAIKPVLSVLENLRFWARLHDPRTGDRTAVTALERMGLERLAEVPGKMLSAGQKRRLNLARLLAAPAPVWLLDEPSVALDRASVKVLEAVIAEHRAGGGMVALSTHADVDLSGARELHLDHFAAAPGVVTGIWA
ncbi:heme ABC exporter ATP-binding protein CcmA [Telmatospirillum sp.]|uniref:heme ABC exporter ATP-binding protein CcmA n=1 Tax=Telmatospirillum sp. TaxID=2079197 RepID=UPI00284D9DF5|nr:heme ABC exporter ATP-binding protein CcmA [Telmatospirillum sp.]MDR3440214.1 heme ABC exporter ATP-binding protein CcmA [Telmatospirillum sp.]